MNNLESTVIIGQLLGIFATIISCCSYQMNTKKSLLIVQTCATACTCLSYYFLGASSGFVLNIVCSLRNAAFYFLNGKKATYASVLFATAMCVLGAFSWQGYISLLIIIPLVINTVCLSLGKPQLLRYSILLTSSTIIVYNVFVFSIGAIINETVTVISSIVGIVRFRSKKKEI